MSKVIGNHVGGSHINQNGGILQDVFNPSTGEVSAQVRFTSASELDNVVKVAKTAAPAWSATAPSKRRQVMYRFKNLLEKMLRKLPIV